MAVTTDYPINSTEADKSPNSLIAAVVKGIGCVFTVTFRFIGESIDVIKSVTVENARKAFVPSADMEAAVKFAAHTKPVDWQQAAVTSCISSGIVFSTVSVQIRLVSPISFDVMSVLIALSFSCMFVSNFIASKHPVTAGVLWFVGLLFLAAVLFTALTIHLTFPVKCVMWFLFGGSIVCVVVVNA